MNGQETPVGLDYSGQLNATLVQTYANGSKRYTPCYLNVKSYPVTATNLTPVADEFAGAETDRYIYLNSDPAKTPYRAYQVIGQTMNIEEG